MRRQTPELLLGESREAFLRRAIDDAGLTLKEFANIAGIPVTSLGTILKRGVGTTSIDTATKICDALEIDLDTLARGKYYSGSSDADIFIVGVSERLREARRALGFREVVLAEMLDISLEHYRRFESAHYMVPPRYVRQLSIIMNVSYEYLMGRQEEDAHIVSADAHDAPEDYEGYDLGAAIKDFRTECNLSQCELATRMGVSEACIQQWESRIRVPKTKDLAELCKVFSQCGLAVKTFAFHNYPSIPESMQLTDKEKLLISGYRSAESKEKRIVEMTLDIEEEQREGTFPRKCDNPL